MNLLPALLMELKWIVGLFEKDKSDPTALPSFNGLQRPPKTLPVQIRDQMWIDLLVDVRQSTGWTRGCRLSILAIALGGLIE